MLNREWKLGKTVAQLVVGERLHITESIEDKDLLLYLGLTNDNNPLYIQHNYAADTPYEAPIVPTVMLYGIIASAISKHLPGPGSHIREQTLTFLQPVYHYETIDFALQIEALDAARNDITIRVDASNAEKQRVIEGIVKVTPPI